MPTTLRTKEFFTEAEAAHSLGISVAKLHMLLDTYVFNDGSTRPADVTFRASDLLLLSYWNRATAEAKVMCMPRRAEDR